MELHRGRAWWFCNPAACKLDVLLENREDVPGGSTLLKFEYFFPNKHRITFPVTQLRDNTISNNTMRLRYISIYPLITRDSEAYSRTDSCSCCSRTLLHRNYYQLHLVCSRLWRPNFDFFQGKKDVLLFSCGYVMWQKLCLVARDLAGRQKVY